MDVGAHFLHVWDYRSPGYWKKVFNTGWCWGDVGALQKSPHVPPHPPRHHRHMTRFRFPQPATLKSNKNRLFSPYRVAFRDLECQRN